MWNTFYQCVMRFNFLILAVILCHQPVLGQAIAGCLVPTNGSSLPSKNKNQQIPNPQVSQWVGGQNAERTYNQQMNAVNSIANEATQNLNSADPDTSSALSDGSNNSDGSDRSAIEAQEASDIQADQEAKARDEARWAAEARQNQAAAEESQAVNSEANRETEITTDAQNLMTAAQSNLQASPDFSPPADLEEPPVGSVPPENVLADVFAPSLTQPVSNSAPSSNLPSPGSTTDQVSHNADSVEAEDAEITSPSLRTQFQSLLPPGKKTVTAAYDALASYFHQTPVDNSGEPNPSSSPGSLEQLENDQARLAGSAAGLPPPAGVVTSGAAATKLGQDTMSTAHAGALDQ